MAGEARLGTMAMAAFVIVLASLGLVEALDRYGAWPVLPALFPIVPLAIAATVAFRMRSLDFNDMMRGGWLGSATIGWAIVGTALSTVVLVAAPVGIALGGGRGLILIGALVAGLALAILLVAPSLRTTQAATMAEALGARFGRPVRAVSALAVILALLPLLTAEAAIVGTVAARMLGLSPQLATDLIVGLAAIACVLGGLRAALAIAAVLGPIIALAYLAPVTAVSIGESWLPMPWTGLFEPEVRTAAARIPNFVVTAFVIALAAGVAAMPTLAFPAWQAARRPATRRHLLLGVAGTAAILLAAPSYAVYGRIAGIDATTDPLGLIVSFPNRVGLSAMPAVLLIGGLASASLVGLATGLATIATTIGNDLYGSLLERHAPSGRRIFIARLSILLAAAAILGLGRLQLGSVAMLAGVALSVAAASLAPLLLVGWRMQRVTMLAAVSAVAVGLWLTVANLLLARFAPQFSGSYLGMGNVAPTVLGPTGWFGLPVGLSGPIGLVCGLGALLGLSLLPGLPWPLIWLRLRHTMRRIRRRLAAKPKPAPLQPAPAPETAPEPFVADAAGTSTVTTPAPPVAPAEMAEMAPSALFGPLPTFRDRKTASVEPAAESTPAETAIPDAGPAKA